MNRAQFQEIVIQILEAESPQELAFILNQNPEFQKADTVLMIQGAARQNEAEGEINFAEMLWEVSDKLISDHKRRSESYLENRIPEVKPNVPWAFSLRKFIATTDKEYLVKAFQELREQGEREIISFLEFYTKDINSNHDFEEAILKIHFRFSIVDKIFRANEEERKYLDDLINRIYVTLRSENRRDEELTLRLWTLYPGAMLINYFSEDLAEAEKKERIEIGIKRCNQAGEIAESLQDAECQVFFIKRLSDHFRKTRDFEKAEHYLSNLISLYRKLNEEQPDNFNTELAESLYALGNSKANQEKTLEAEQNYLEALKLYEELIAKEVTEDYRESIGGLLTNLGELKYNEINFAAAEYYYERAVSVLWGGKSEPPVNEGFAMLLNNYGILLHDQKRFALSERIHLLALETRRKLAASEPDKPGKYDELIAQSLSNLAVSQNILDKAAESEDSIKAAIELYQKLVTQNPEKYLSQLARTLNILGSFQCEQGNITEGKETLSKSLEIGESLHSNSPLAANQHIIDGYHNTGFQYLRNGDFDKGIAYLEKARIMVGHLFDEAITIDERNRILSENVRVFEHLLLAYHQINELEKIVEIAEQNKSRSLSDFLNLKYEGVMPDPLLRSHQSQSYINELGGKYYQLIKSIKEIESQEKFTSQQIIFWNDADHPEREEALDFHLDKQKSLVSEKFKSYGELRYLKETIRNYDPSFPPKAKSLSAQAIKDLSQKTNRVIIIFRVLIDSVIMIFVFPNNKIVVENVTKLSRNLLHTLYWEKWRMPYEQNKRNHLDENDWKNGMAEVLKEIDDRLIFKVREVLENETDFKQLLFVPSQSLALLPLHAATHIDKQGKLRYLLQDYTISYAPSIAVFKRCLENQTDYSNKTLFVTNPTADANLKYTEIEVERIKQTRLYDYYELPKAFKAATISNVSKELTNSDYGFVHFACHGQYFQMNPFESGLIMNDGSLSLAEITKINLKKNWLTTLSACETGMVDFQSSTDEHFGLPLGFVFAGSPSIWASLWSVSDMATSEIMVKAYQLLGNEKYRYNKPEALREAQLSMFEKFPHPFFWAGFQHFGV